MATASLAFDTPREIRRALGRVAGRLRTVQAMKGLGTLAMVASMGAIAGIAADFAWPLPMVARWGIWSAWLGLSILVALFAVVRPLFRHLEPVDLAALAERGQPELAERLIGAVALIGEGERTHGSRALIAALTGQAAEHAGAIDAGRAVSADRAMKRLAIGLAAVMAVALPPLLRPDPFATIARRFFAPWSDVDRVGQYQLRVTPGDKVVAIGSDLTVNARLSPRFSFGGSTPDAAWLEWDDAELKTPRRLRMALMPAGGGSTRLFEAKIPRVAATIHYRVTTEPATSRRFEINAVEPPTIAEIKAMVEPPAYTQLPPALAKDPARIEAIEGSAVTLTLVATRPVEAFEVGWPTFGTSEELTRPLVVSTGPDGKTAVARGLAESAGSYVYTTKLRRDAHRLDGPRESRRINVRPDAPPTLDARSVDARESGPDDILSLPIRARDDFAVALAELHYSIKRTGSDEPEPTKIDVLLDGLGTRRAAGEAALGLKPLGLNPGDVIAYRIKVADNRPAPKGPNVVWSEVATLTIVAKAEPMLARRDRLHRERVAERLEEIKKANLATRHEATQLRYHADTARRDPAAWDKEKVASLDARESAARRVVDDLNALARDLNGDPTYGPLARPTKAVADVEADAAHTALDDSRRAPDAEKRLASLRGADARLGAVHLKIEDLQRQLDALAKLDSDRQRLRELASREDALAAQARENPNDLNALRADQDKVRRDLDALASQSPDLKAGLLEDQAKQAADLAEKARQLAARQRDEARKTAENAGPAGEFKALAEAQRQIEADARRLALDVDEPLAENGRARLNAKPIGDAIVPIERGEIAPGRQRLEEAENELRRLARDLEDAPADPKALARRLVQRQDSLARHVAEAVREAKGKNTLAPKEQAALAKATKPMAAEQEAILKLAEAIKVDEPRKGAVREASQAVGRALENLKNVRPRESEARQNEARQALNRLAEALPDQWKRDEPARQKLEEARRMAEEATRDLDRHLRETAPQPGKPHDPSKAAVDLANRLAPMAKREVEAADKLAAMDVSPRVEPQRRRAERRARALAAAMESIRKDAASLPPTPTTLVPIKDWQLVGPLGKNIGPPFKVNDPINPSAKFKDKKGGPVSWKPAKAVDARGKVDLVAIYGPTTDATAFAYAEVVRSEAGTARFSIGSDDTMIVWVNGKQVFTFDGSRGYGPDQGTFDAPLTKGLNRVVVRCGNGSDSWAFGVEVAPSHPETPAMARVETSRRALPQAALETRAALDRLTHKLHGYATPADDAAEELAAEAAEVAKSAAKADPDARHEAAQEQHRLATALRNLQVPDAPAMQAEAVRLADAAAKALDAPQVDAAPIVKQAAEAAQAMADRLTDRISPKAEAKALAKAERALNAPDAPREPSARIKQGRAIAAQAARLDASTKPESQPDAKPAASDVADRAVDLAERATRGPSGDPNNPTPTPAGVAAAREEAAARLDELAARVPEVAPDAAMLAAPPRDRAIADAPRDPEVAALTARAVEAKALANRERQVRERLESILGERVAPQEALRHEAAALGREFADLRDRTREASPHSHGPANNAAEILTNQAPQIMDRAGDELAQGHPDPARENQRHAAEAVERAAQAAEDLVAAIKTDIPADAVPTDIRPARDALAEAGRRLAGEAQSEAPSSGQAAARSMQRAAQAMRTAARPAPGQTPDGPAMAFDGPTLDPKSTPAGVAPADLSELQAMVKQKSGRAWGELPGHLRTEILQLSQGKYRDDYARLIQLYFKEIAADAGSKPAK